MKIKILATALCAIALGFSACDDDDDDAILSTHPEKEIAGKSFDGVFQQVNTKTNDTTYVDGSVAFAATDSAYVCTVTATVGSNAYSYNANVVKTSNGFLFYNEESSPISTTGFHGTVVNEDEVTMYFERPVKTGRKTVNNIFTFSNSK